MSRGIAPQLESSFDRDAALALVRDLVRIPSVTGTERALAQHCASVLRAAGADVVDLDLFDDRGNVLAIFTGTTPGPTIVIAGHLDVVGVDGFAEHWGDDPRRDPFGAVVHEGAIWGRGVGDLKGGIAAAISAVRTVLASGTGLAGTIIFALVSDEETREGMGRSAGIKRLLPRLREHCPKADLAIYVEPTKLDIYVAQIGFYVADVTITGKSAYFSKAELGVDALKAGVRALELLWGHDETLRARGTHPLLGPRFLLPTTAQAGGLIAVPGECKISLIAAALPGDELDDAKTELEDLLRNVSEMDGITVDITYSSARDHNIGGSPAEVSPDLDILQPLAAAAAEVRIGTGAMAGAPYWSESPFFLNQLQTPTVYFGPGDISNCHTFDEHVDVDEYLDAVAILAGYLLSVCGRA
jgi:acetylornithine deacetylase/succinyl-diaminopimelate desuccinylase-like protein